MWFEYLRKETHAPRRRSQKDKVDEGKGQQGFDSKDVKFFVPKTELAKSLLQMQMDMMNKEKGIST